MLAALLAALTLPAALAEEARAAAATYEAARRAEVAREVDLNDGVGAYVALAMQSSPTIRGDWSRWEASVRRVAQARGLPEPTLSFGVFLRSVETRVGPQQARVSLQQTFPWPTALSASADAAGAEAQAAHARLEAHALALDAAVRGAYWSLWELRAVQEVYARHLVVLDGLADAARGRLEVGSVSLADLQQVELSRARLADELDRLASMERASKARLVQVVGAGPLEEVPTAQAPGPATRPAGVQALPSDLHPQLDASAALVQAAEARVRVAKAQRLPGFGVGVDWILTGPSTQPDMADSGKDAVAVGLALRVPLWQVRYASQVQAAEATADAARADAEGVAQALRADVEAALAQVEDSARRVELISGTLRPQAEALYDSALGSYAAGRAGLAQVMLAQRDLLDLEAAEVRARAAHARAWAELDAATGSDRARHDEEASP
ncbi:MAG: TolC family protein [Alphaproteobacteria bacterium]|nr:TolC family protein [Alphaproteobacteria bacterium]